MSPIAIYLTCAGAILLFVGGMGTWSAIAAHKEKTAKQQHPSGS